MLLRMWQIIQVHTLPTTILVRSMQSKQLTRTIPHCLLFTSLAVTSPVCSVIFTKCCINFQIEAKSLPREQPWQSNNLQVRRSSEPNSCLNPKLSTVSVGLVADSKSTQYTDPYCQRRGWTCLANADLTSYPFLVIWTGLPTLCWDQNIGTLPRAIVQDQVLSPAEIRISVQTQLAVLPSESMPRERNLAPAMNLDLRQRIASYTFLISSGSFESRVIPQMAPCTIGVNHLEDRAVAASASIIYFIAYKFQQNLLSRQYSDWVCRLAVRLKEGLYKKLFQRSYRRFSFSYSYFLKLIQLREKFWFIGTNSTCVIKQMGWPCTLSLSFDLLTSTRTAQKAKQTTPKRTCAFTTSSVLSLGWLSSAERTCTLPVVRLKDKFFSGWLARMRVRCSSVRKSKIDWSIINTRICHCQLRTHSRFSYSAAWLIKTPFESDLNCQNIIPPHQPSSFHPRTANCPRTFGSTQPELVASPGEAGLPMISLLSLTPLAAIYAMLVPEKYPLDLINSSEQLSQRVLPWLQNWMLQKSMRLPTWLLTVMQAPFLQAYFLKQGPWGAWVIMCLGRLALSQEVNLISHSSPVPFSMAALSSQSISTPSSQFYRTNLDRLCAVTLGSLPQVVGNSVAPNALTIIFIPC